MASRCTTAMMMTMMTMIRGGGVGLGGLRGGGLAGLRSGVCGVSGMCSGESAWKAREGRMWFSAQARSGGGSSSSSGGRERGGGGRERGGGGQYRGQGGRFEPVQGLAANKFTPKNRNVVSVVKDLTGGQAPRTIFRNAMLSLDAKKRMRDMYASDPKKHSAAELAKRFKVSEQRVLAIIALGELRDRYYAENGGDGVAPPLDESLNVGMQKWFGSVYDEGDGEKHLEMKTSEPRFRIGDMVFGNLALSSKEAAAKTASNTRSASTPAARLERFRERLDWNMLRTGPTISRKPRSAMNIKRPKEGWSIVVTPMRSVRKAQDTANEKPLTKPYVARRDGTQRELTDDEMLYLRRMKPSLRSS